MRHFTSSAGSVDKFTAVLLPARSDIGQEYHKAVHGNSTQQLQLKQVQEIGDHNGHSASEHARHSELIASKRVTTLDLRGNKDCHLL